MCCLQMLVKVWDSWELEQCFSQIVTVQTEKPPGVREELLGLQLHAE